MDRHVEVTTRRLAPNEGLVLGYEDHTLAVRKGVLYVSLKSGDKCLIPGDEIVAHAGDFRGAWGEAHDGVELLILRGG